VNPLHSHLAGVALLSLVLLVGGAWALFGPQK
jgi:hypothetical protein